MFDDVAGVQLEGFTFGAVNPPTDVFLAEHRRRGTVLIHANRSIDRVPPVVCSCLAQFSDERRLIVPPENDTVDIGPKFLAHVEDAIEADLEQPLLSSFGPGAILPGIIEVGNTRSGAVAANLGEVEVPATRICSAD